jgi:ABC-type nitrate/sulfonate/bicarbonate transport system permease component
MTIEFIYALVASVAGVFGAIAGRVFAVEAQNTIAAVLSATYVGAGAGLVSSLPLGSLLTLVATLWNSQEFATMFDALDVSGRAVMLGTGAGAAGGLAISIAVVATKLWQRSS